MKVMPAEYYRSSQKGQYHLLPFRFTRLPDLPGEVLMTSEVGEYLFLSEADFQSLITHTLSPEQEVYHDLIARHFR
jgi:hypothetical protein